MDGMGHGGFARGQTAHPMCPIQFISPEGAWYPHSPAIGGRISS